MGEKMRTKELFDFIKERHLIYERRAAGKSRPWTKDPILQQYRFCNVYRELDKVTIWIRENWRDPHATVPHLWFAMAVSRLVNWPDTLGEMGFPVPWRGAKFVATLHGRKARGLQFMSGAYLVSTNGVTMDKAEYLEQRVLSPLWQQRAKVMPRDGDTLAAFCTRLQEHNGFAGFMAGQVVCDTKFAGVLRRAPDWWTFAISGPGSRRGLNWVLERPVDTRWREADWNHALLELQAKIDPLVAKAGMPRVSAQDLQNCLCEKFKYARGFSRNKYPGAA